MGQKCACQLVSCIPMLRKGSRCGGASLLTGQQKISLSSLLASASRAEYSLHVCLSSATIKAEVWGSWYKPMLCCSLQALRFYFLAHDLHAAM